MHGGQGSFCLWANPLASHKWSWSPPLGLQHLSPFTERPHPHSLSGWGVSHSGSQWDSAAAREGLKTGQWQESPLKPSQASITPVIDDEGREQWRRGLRAPRERERGTWRDIKQTLCERVLQEREKQRSLLVEHYELQAVHSHTLSKPCSRART